MLRSRGGDRGRQKIVRLLHLNRGVSYFMLFVVSYNTVHFSYKYILQTGKQACEANRKLSGYFVLFSARKIQEKNIRPYNWPDLSIDHFYMQSIHPILHIPNFDLVPKTTYYFWTYNLDALHKPQTETPNFHPMADPLGSERNTSYFYNIVGGAIIWSTC